MKIIIIDFMFFLHKNNYAFPDLKVDNQYTGCIFGFFKDLLYINKNYNPDKIIISLEGGKNQIRKSLDPNYKLTRYPDTENHLKIYSQKKIVIEMCDYLGLERIRIKGYESDDAMASYCKNNLDKEIIIASNDHDMFQALLNDNVKLLRHIKHNYILFDSNDFKTMYSIPPTKYLEVMTLSGCSTDKVPGINGIGELKAIKVLENYNTVKELYNDKNNWNFSECIKNKLLDGYESAKLSRKLVKLYDEIQYESKKKEKNIKEFINYLEKFKMKHHLEKIHEFEKLN